MVLPVLLTSSFYWVFRSLLCMIMYLKHINGIGLKYETKTVSGQAGNDKICIIALCKTPATICILRAVVTRNCVSLSSLMVINRQSLISQ